MKRTILFLAAAIALVMGAKAQQQTATLQQNGSTTAYYGLGAFREAYAAAKTGAVITLSEGSFDTVDSITKPITIIGSGYVGSITTFFSNTLQMPITITYPYSYRPKIEVNQVDLIINCDNVIIEGIKFNHPVVLRKMTGLRLGHCYFSELCSTGANTNAIIDQCYIKSAWGAESAINGTVKNSFVDNMRWLQFNYLNSVIYKSRYWGHNDNMILGGSSICRNCILGDLYYWEEHKDDDCYWSGYSLSVLTNWGTNGSSSSSNCVFFLYPFNEEGLKEDYLASHLPCNTNLSNGNTTSTWDDLFNEDLQWTDPAYIKTNVLGDDGTVVGPYGGTGFSLYPSIPRITESKIDTYTNEEGKLNVKVKVEVGQ